jgi:hypothetical protein
LCSITAHFCTTASLPVSFCASGASFIGAYRIPPETGLIRVLLCIRPARVPTQP